MKSAIVIGIGSDIARELSFELSKNNWKIFGTIRGKSQEAPDHIEGLVNDCDLTNRKSIDKAILRLKEMCHDWDALIMSPASMEPIGLFSETSEDDWVESIFVNFINQVQIVRKLLPSANLDSKIGPVVIFFAGGGTNSSTVGFSAYTISKIALIKMTELLDAELPQIRFVIIGPGWVETKIHNQTLANSQSPINIREETKRRIAQGDFIQVSKVVETIFWALSAPRDLIGGRNFSVADDPITSKDFQLKLREDNNLFKLRRYGNMNFKEE